MWLHGFTQTKESALTFQSILTGTYEVITIDLPGHGENAEISATLDETAQLLADALPESPFILGGYSYGARVALHFSLRHGERLRQLILLGATRGIYDDVERRERQLRDEVLAQRIESIGTNAFLEEWLAQPMFQRLPDDPAERATRSRDAAGLARSLRHSGTGTQRWLEPQLATLSVPTLALAGELDQKFSREAFAIASTVPDAHAALVPDAGHAAHLEHPVATAELIVEYQPK